IVSMSYLTVLRLRARQRGWAVLGGGLLFSPSPALLLWSEASKEPRNLFQWPLRCGEADSLQGFCCQFFQPLQAERQVCSAFGAYHGVNLIDNHDFNASQDLTGIAGEKKIERLRSGDEDVRGMALEVSAFT